MAAQVARIVIYLLLLFMLCGIGIFMKGFFPLKKNSPGFSSLNVNGSKVPGKFDRLIIIMIDALRADFVFNNQSYMSFTKDLIEQGSTYSFQAYSHPPTVTMPRIKAITTGTIPGFIDVILNVDSKTLQEDNIVTQMKISNRKILFFGDDTWIKLFPNHFKRADGTSSFFVIDYTEVDNNVTRHLKPELNRNDWDVMILHYLGLDHIGHLAGPTSPLVPPKLTEMDNVIEMIYNIVVKQDIERNMTTLMMLCGDHGMSDGGSHGGSSSAETTTPLVFISSLFQHGQGRRNYNLKVSQIDIAPTLALLTGLSIPKNSIGILIPKLFSLHSPKQHLEALRMNSLQILEVFGTNAKERNVIELDMARKLHDEWLTTYTNDSDFGSVSRAEKISALYMSAMHVMTSELTKAMSSYDKYALYIGMWLLVQSFLGTLSVKFNFISNGSLHSSLQFSTGFLVLFPTTCFSAYIHLYCCSMQSLGTSELFCTFSVVSICFSSIFILSTGLTLTVLIFVLVNLRTSLLLSRLQTLLYLLTGKSQTEIFLIFGILLHNVSLLSTSFIEEEHQTWYFLTTSYHLILSCLEYLPCTPCEKQNGEKMSEDRDVTNNVLNTANCDVKEKSYPRNQCDNNIAANSRGETLFMLLVLLCCDKILRSWNQTGIKWADQPDVGDWLVNPENKIILSCLLIVALVSIAVKTYMETKKKFIIFLVFITGIFAVYVYRAVTGLVFTPWKSNFPQKGIAFAQWVHVCVIFIVLTSIFEFLKACYDGNKERTQKKDIQMSGELFLIGYLLLILLLLRPHNIPLVALMVLQTCIHYGYIWKRCRSNLEIILSAYYIGWFTYFAQGNSNSLATVDIAAGYIGLDQNYSLVLVGLLTSLATFSGPIFWMINAVLFIKKRENNTSCSTSAISEICTTLLLIKSLNLTVCAVMSWLNCYHLFVWSVFSPKLLYEGVTSFVFSIFILIIYIIN